MTVQTAATQGQQPSANAPVYAVIQSVAAPPRVWGFTPEARARRMLAKMGITAVLNQGQAWPTAGSVILLAGDAVIDEALLEGLLESPGVAVTDGDGHEVLAAHVDAAQAPHAARWLGRRPPPDSAFSVLSPRAVAKGYRGSLRKRTDPVCRRVAPGQAGSAERRLYDAAYKGVTDLVTKWVWPGPAFWATRACARLGITPNMVTLLSAVLVGLVIWLFWIGAFGWGLLAAWAMTFLDTVDGKLARVTLTSSAFGDVFDHVLDLVHPPIWYAAWGIGLTAAGASLPANWLAPAIWIIFLGYIGGRLCEGYFLSRFGLEIHMWERFDSRFRLITARRNPNLLLLTAFWLAGRPDWGLLAVAAWHVASDGVHLVRIAQAEALRQRGTPVVSWLRTAA
ncbi:Phosphatidylglycerophosphate synthase [Limimonas halophila]|uniref:Phosphatidylglycerophosphate synthase n=1 Tax=Limimonas halophila TaxID=1082479 RepID=A0A1G7PQ02_9PROT|nr:CDP-alcohol phosphatidyltransferase family protein [Limimonas halophila]SDF88336.1 Phosphatidylglycerophosphate synthase [Limimonas halophila]